MFTFSKLFPINSCGVVSTPALGEHKESVCQYFKNILPLRKVVAPKDVAELVAFLISEKAHCITGAEFSIDCAHLIAKPPI